MKLNLLSAIASALVPGTGQLINRHWVKGTGFFVGAMIASGMLRRNSILFSDVSGSGLARFFLVALLLVLAAWSAADAYRDSGHASPHH